MKKVLMAVTLVTFLFGSAMPAAAVSPLTMEHAKKQRTHQSCGKHQAGFEAIIKQSLEKNNRDLAKVKQDLDKLFADKKVQREAKLQELAKQKGVSVDELKAQCKQKRQQKLQQRAAEQGLNPDQLKQEMEKKHQARMEQMAKNLGLTPEQLKQILPAHNDKW